MTNVRKNGSGRHDRQLPWPGERSATFILTFYLPLAIYDWAEA